MMKRRTMGIKAILLATTMVLMTTGCNAKTDGVTVKENKNVSTNKVAMKKMDAYKNVQAEDWLDNDHVIDNHLRQYDLSTKKTTSLFPEPNLVMASALSPDKKHLYYNINKDGRDFNFILDLINKKRVNLASSDGMINPYDVNWIDNENITFTNDKLESYISDVNGKVTKIDQGSMSSVTKAQNRMFYLKDRKLYVWDTKTNQKKLLMDNVENYTLSPDKTRLAVEKMETDKETLMMMDLEGKKKTKMVESKMVGGIGWSPDSSKIAYFTVKSEQSAQTELYVSDVKSLKSTLLSVNILSFFESEHVIWSPKGDKLFVNGFISGSSEEDSPPSLYVITLK
jgi:hypothetical protein